MKERSIPEKLRVAVFAVNIVKVQAEKIKQENRDEATEHNLFLFTILIVPRLPASDHAQSS